MDQIRPNVLVPPDVIIAMKRATLIWSKCPKPRLECSNCKLLGHESKPTTYAKIICPMSPQECYFVDGEINDKPIRAYVDRSCSIVTIRRKDAMGLQLKSQPITKAIKGCAGGVTQSLQSL
ncbi:hypothetical protein PPYR_13153 [Photinus pyralis]|uniref:Uncharacterized protein n=1 Tax=Photinus pyralis TaxID=7054 RepID=A0A5N4A882_PHOPY|nr:hypothetical protein PPYR_13153 [Photinus pyralis]